ncbi:MAG: hydrogenase maturation nickel metallochaperone HypA [Lachnospiraceae bacterium]|nr:hydrogenase maturation nickel metallochaperone HypA [Lachnospiraceae bacterium]
MHEMALVRRVVDIVVTKAEAVGASEVHAVHLVIGEARDIVEDYFEGLFQYLARGTVAENAEMVIYRVPYTVRCNQCGFIFPINIFNEETWVCPACKAKRDYKLNSGMEFAVKNIEVAFANPEQCRQDEQEMMAAT